MTTEADLVDTLTDAKEVVRSGDHSDEALAALDHAKSALVAFRSALRKNRDVSASPADGVAAPETVQVTTEGG